MRAVAASALMGLALVAIALFFVRRPSGDLAALAAARELSAKPLILPAIGAATSMPATASPTSVAPLTSAVTPQADTMRDPSEVSLLNTLQAAAPLTAEGIVVTEAQIDPRDSRVTLTVVCRPDSALPDIRQTILRDAQTVLAQAVQATDIGLSQFTVRCLLAPSVSQTVPGGNSTSPSLVFVADTTRTAVTGYDSSLAPDITHLQSLYTNPWWLPSLPIAPIEPTAPGDTPAPTGTS